MIPQLTTLPSVYINPPRTPQFHTCINLITILKSSSPSSNPYIQAQISNQLINQSNHHHLNPPLLHHQQTKMKPHLIIAFLPLFLTTALAIPTAQPSDTDPVEVCTEATDGQPCIVVEVDGVRVAGRCIFDLASRSCFPPSSSSYGLEWDRKEGANKAGQLLPSGSICFIE